MRIEIKDSIITKIKELIKGNMVSKLEVYSDDKKKDIIDKYIGANLERFKEYKITLEEYDNGLSTLIIEGLRTDKTGNLENYKGYGIIKDNVNVLGYSFTDSMISFIQMIEPNISSDKMLYGKDMINRERFNLYINGNKRFYLETFKDASSNKIIYERYHDFADKDIKKVNLYYDVLENPIYGLVNDEVQPKIADSYANDISNIINDTNKSVENDLVIKK